MKTTTDYLDKIKQERGLPSDYAIAKALKTNPSTVSNWRIGRSHIGAEFAPRVAELAGVDECEVLLAAQIERAKSPEERAIWERLLKRLGGMAAGFVLVAGMGVAPSPTQAAMHQVGANFGSSLYYVNLTQPKIRH